jgi:sporulation protein YlmC with PRC-barrel domain
MSAAMQWNAIEASSFIGSQVRDIRGFDLGQIHCFTVDPASGRISNVVLSDVPGMGAEFVFVPFASLTRTGANIFVHTPPEDAYYFYGESPYWTEGFYAYSQQPPKEAYAGSLIIGAAVQTSGGEEIARIDDVVIDFGSGHVAYFVLSDFKGMEQRMVAVPCGSLSKAHEGVFVVNVDRDRLLASPAFTWRNTTDWRYTGDIYRYYGLQPYWESE